MSAAAFLADVRLTLGPRLYAPDWNERDAENLRKAIDGIAHLRRGFERYEKSFGGGGFDAVTDDLAKIERVLRDHAARAMPRPGDGWQDGVPLHLIGRAVLQ